MRDAEAEPSAGRLPHLTDTGHVHMVEVSEKADTVRTARAEGFVDARRDVLQLVREGTAPKGDVLSVARVAGIQAAKHTADLVPLAHPLALTGVSVELEILEDQVRVEAAVSTRGPTGVEMEALAAVVGACLTVYDMLKAQDRAMTIGPIRLLEKTGGRSGTFRRGGDSA